MKKSYYGSNCIVTGGAGFIGQNLVHALIGKGANVYVIDNFSYGAERANVNRNAHLFVGHVNNYETFTKLPDLEYKYLFHFAGPSSIVLFDRNRSACISETVLGLLNAARYCSERSIKLIFPSSGSLYSGTTPPQKETLELNLAAMNSYARTKYCLEQVQNAFGADCKMLALRIFAGYGPSERHKGDIASVVYSFCEKMYHNEAPVIYGDGRQERDFIYISDLVDAVLALAENCSEKVVNVGSGESVSFGDLVGIINRVLGRSIVPVFVDKPNAYLEKTLADTSLLKKYFARNMTSIERGVEEITASFKATS